MRNTTTPDTPAGSSGGRASRSGQFNGDEHVLQMT